MNYCPRCDIVIRGHKECCPLCEGKVKDVPLDIEVSSNAKTDAFPVIERKVSSVTFIKIITFAFVALEICGFMTQIAVNKDMAWLNLAMIGLVVAWVDVLVTMYLRNNLLKVVTVEAYVAIVVNIVVDYLTHMHGWSVTWVVPSMLFGLLLSTFTFAYFRQLRPNEYLSYIAFDSIVALCQLIFIRRGSNWFIYPAIICITLYLISMAGIVIFRYKDLVSALQRRFNV